MLFTKYLYRKTRKKPLPSPPKKTGKHTVSHVNYSTIILDASQTNMTTKYIKIITENV